MFLLSIVDSSFWGLLNREKLLESIFIEGSDNPKVENMELIEYQCLTWDLLKFLMIQVDWLLLDWTDWSFVPRESLDWFSLLLPLIYYTDSLSSVNSENKIMMPPLKFNLRGSFRVNLRHTSLENRRSFVPWTPDGYHVTEMSSSSKKKGIFVTPW